MSLGSILKGVLKIVATGATVVVPGAGPVVAAGEAIIDNKGSEESIEQAVLAGLNEFEELKPENIADPVKFNMCVAAAHDNILGAISAVHTKPVIG